MTCKQGCEPGQTCACEERDRQSMADEFWSLLIEAFGWVLICALLGLTLGLLYGVMK